MLRTNKKQSCSLLFLTLLYPCALFPVHTTRQLTSTQKICRTETADKRMITYTLYNPKKPAQTVSARQHIASNGAVSYSGVRKKGSIPPLLMKPEEAQKLFDSFKKEYSAAHEHTSSVNS